jgi:general secretion pathway protein E
MNSLAPLRREAPENIVQELLTLLVESGATTTAAVERARRAAELSDARIDQVLTKLGLVKEDDIARGWSKLLRMPVFDTANLPAEPACSDKLSPRFIRDCGVIPVAEDDNSVGIAVLDPLDGFAPQAVSARTGKAVTSAIITRSTFEAAFTQLYPDAREVSAVHATAPHEDVVAGDVTRLQDLSTDAPAIHLVNATIENAVEQKASDVHISVGRAGARLRYRVDGVLKDVEPHPIHLHSAVVSRLKVLANLDIAEHRLPQDGRIRFGVGGREIDMRIATMPHLEGEGVVLRILDRSSVRLDLPGLGFPPHIEQELNQLLTEPHGIFLVTGPTGSGKTTTLYAALRKLVQPERNVISVEDPVEYHLDGVAQIQIQRKIGLDFPTILRAVLRQDPDIIMIGEIRDAETAMIANQAALTGHFVLATLHTNSAAGAIPRLIDMGVEPYLLSSTLRGVMSQRLLRTLCPHCNRSVKCPDASLTAHLERLGARNHAVLNFDGLREAVGCARCNHSGFAGRTAIAEILVVDEDVRHTILKQADAARFEALALRQGHVPLIEAGLDRVLAGETTLIELFRVTGEVARS